jgi:hypothetical protein
LYFSPVAQIVVLNVDADVTGHLGPPVVAGYKLEGLEAACMSDDACIVVLYYLYLIYIFTLDFPWLDLSGGFSLSQ